VSTQHGETVIFDVDGTLVDTNYHHAIAWFRAFQRHGVTVPVWRVHRAIGMGGDRLVAHVAGTTSNVSWATPCARSGNGPTSR
jgi:beta-phosphoglucomutase-like phosphatase (HAD superfamily)